MRPVGMSWSESAWALSDGVRAWEPVLRGESEEGSERGRRGERRARRRSGRRRGESPGAVSSRWRARGSDRPCRREAGASRRAGTSRPRTCRTTCVARARGGARSRDLCWLSRRPASKRTVCRPHRSARSTGRAPPCASPGVFERRAPSTRPSSTGGVVRSEQSDPLSNRLHTILHTPSHTFTHLHTPSHTPSHLDPSREPRRAGGTTLQRVLRRRSPSSTPLRGEM
jgi:hypothetical protein